MASALLSGSFDQRCCVADVRSPGAPALRWELGSDVECCLWHPAQQELLLVSTEDGCVNCFDARRGGGAPALFTLAAHSKPACTLALSRAAPSLLATGSTDKSCKLWDIGGGRPELLASQDLKVGAVFGAAFCADAPHLLAAGGAKGTVTVWDVTADDTVASRFGKALGRPLQTSE
jgi:periodic tryptophan protein 1